MIHLFQKASTKWYFDIFWLAVVFSVFVLHHSCILNPRMLICFSGSWGSDTVYANACEASTLERVWSMPLCLGQEDIANPYSFTLSLISLIVWDLKIATFYLLLICIWIFVPFSALGSSMFSCVCRYRKGGHLVLPSCIMRTHGSKELGETLKKTPIRQLQPVFEVCLTLSLISATYFIKYA